VLATMQQAMPRLSPLLVFLRFVLSPLSFLLLDVRHGLPRIHGLLDVGH